MRLIRLRAALNLVFATAILCGLSLPVTAATLYESLFDDFAADWTPSVSNPVVDQGTGVAVVSAAQGQAFGRANSELITMDGFSFDALDFSLNLSQTGNAGARVWIAYFQGTTFLDAENLITVAGAGPLDYEVAGTALAGIPTGADAFKLVLFALSSTSNGTGFDSLVVNAPEPALALPTALMIVGMLRARRRQR